jgi:phosphotransferase system  glucose/maltose/N-acetylglucosamine-specific IIC component
MKEFILAHHITKGDFVWGSITLFVALLLLAYVVESANRGEPWARKIFDPVIDVVVWVIVRGFWIVILLTLLWGLIALIHFFWNHS